MTDISTSTRGRGIRTLAALGALAGVALLTLAPRSLIAPARGAFMRALDALTAPVLVWIPYDDAERVLNTLLFVPLGAAVALLLSRRAWPWAVAAGFALSAAVEYLQGSIPGRVPDPSDVMWNTIGAVVGVAAVTLPRMLAAAWARRRRQRLSPGSTALT